MQKRLLISILLVCGCLSQNAFGADQSQDLISGISAHQVVSTEASAKQDEKSTLEFTAGADQLVGDGSFLEQASLFAEGRYRLSEMWQFGGSFAVRAQGDESAMEDVAVQALLGPTYNFGSGAGIQRDFFVSPKLGATVGKRKDLVTGESAMDANPTLSLHLGKRFEVSKNVSFGPAVGFVAQFGETPAFMIQPIALSIFL